MKLLLTLKEPLDASIMEAVLTVMGAVLTVMEFDEYCDVADWLMVTRLLCVAIVGSTANGGLLRRTLIWLFAPGALFACPAELVSWSVGDRKLVSKF